MDAGHGVMFSNQTLSGHNLTYLDKHRFGLEDLFVCNLPKDFYVDIIPGYFVYLLFKPCRWHNVCSSVVLLLDC